MTLGSSEEAVDANIGLFEQEIENLKRQLTIQEDGFKKQAKEAEMTHKKILLSLQREAAKTTKAKLAALRKEQATVERQIAKRRAQPGRAAKAKQATQPN